MLAILYVTYLSTLGILENDEITKDDLDLIQSIDNQNNNNNFISSII